MIDERTHATLSTLVRNMEQEHRAELFWWWVENACLSPKAVVDGWRLLDPSVQMGLVNTILRGEACMNPPEPKPEIPL